MTLEELKAENARLKAELAYDKRVQLHVDKLAAEFTQSEVERLKAEVARLRKAGDNLARASDENGCHDNGDADDLDDAIERWKAARKGKQP